eukprot:CAMPEP_0115024230 /NCGR_PEP_ID=MMETSP0216-20121206/33053_1 /TAXON_ID=223996 /ORGANISM="Protocruzia adherens, Strain Boccale" /LENGTH=523 /DNA_ID=CAMNT_0002398127 /DNA_START=16 /DNA_END=1587 /DNA_ORIENTATION=-
MATDNKYDRQLRLWGSHGQKKLMDASIVFLGASPINTETAKNLVLPGVGKVTIVDNQDVTSRDLGNNFFVSTEYLGKPRADCVAALVQELNPDVTVSGIKDDPVTLINDNPEFFSNYSLVVASQLRHDQSKKLCELCKEKNIPLITQRQYGLLGYLRLYKNEHLIIESKPQDKVIDDLRTADPFPELLEFAQSFKLSELPDHLHSHVPYAVILIQLMQAWIKDHDGKRPSTTAEKDEFRNLVKSTSRAWGNEENFKEAYENSYKSFNTSSIPFEVQQVIDDEKAKNPGADDDIFWFVVSAIKKFMDNEGNGALPLIGSIPDMTSDTDSYINLQSIYNTRSTDDFEKTRKHLDDTLAAAGRSSEDVSDEYFQRFCKNVYTLDCLRYRDIDTEINKPNSDDISCEFFDEDSLVHWYYALRAVDAYAANNGGVFPGVDEVTEDLVDQLSTLVRGFMTDAKLENGTVNEDILKEIIRYGASEIHNVAAFMGGVTSQEAIKLISEQYLPLNNTFLYSGITAKIQQLEL